MSRKLLIALLIVFFACSEKSKNEGAVVEQKSLAPAPVRNERPVMTFTLTTGEQIDAHGIDQQAVFIFFQPDCDHCQQEATQIRNRLEAFNDYQLYFISSHPMSVIEKFSRDYGLANFNNVHFGHTPVESVWNNYGSISAPSVYVYSKEGRLVESFEGMVDVEVIIKHL